MASTPALAHHRLNRPLIILLVDRDDDTREMYGEFLRQCGSEVEEAQDGRQALAIALARLPDVVITGRRLPGMSGLDLCRVLRQDPAAFAVPIVFLTGDVAEDDTRRALRAGATIVLGKPCLPDVLVSEIQRLLAGSPTGDDAPVRRPSPSINASSSDNLQRAAEPSQRRAMLNHVYGRRTTTEPPVAPPTLVCPSCYQSLRYLQSYIGGVSARLPEQWDYYECETGCGTFQYRHRTRKLRQIT
jgi:two-component system, cell cycle response regulator DivK